jgi:outer membrane lipopolysaccharide assembly protein LptE/RlpB
MRTLFFLLPALLLAGCYTFNPKAVPSNMKTLEIPVVGNRTLEPALSEQVTKALTDRFISDNTLKVVQKNADAVLEGEVTGYQDRVIGFNSSRQANEYLVILTMKLALRDRTKNKEIWSSDAVVGRSSYFLESAQGGVNSETDARALAIKQVADFAISRTVEGW